MPIAEERLARLEQQVDNLASGLADVKMAIGELRAEMVAFRGEVRTELANFRDSVDRRFESTNQKIDRDYRSLVILHMGTLAAIVGALIGAYYR